MNIAIDISHIAYWNFYKNIIKKLENQEHNVYIFIRERGPLLKVVQKEYKNQKNVIITGKYYKGRKKLFLHLLRIPVLIYFLYKYKVDVVSSDTFFIGLASKFKNIPAILHSDDFEYTFSYKMTQLFSSKMIIPDVFPKTSKKDIYYRGCKENAYLGKDYFTPQEHVLNNIISDSSKYVFIRLVSKSSLNYLKADSIENEIEKLIGYLNERNIMVLIFSEDSYKTNNENCKILNPPIKDFHSILKYALCTVTEGDTMARESAVLGTPVVYMGGRTMRIHNYFNQYDSFLETNKLSDIIPFFENILGNEASKEIEYNFDDINQVMVDYIVDKENNG